MINSKLRLGSLLFLIVLGLDLSTKLLASVFLKVGEVHVIWPDIFELNLVYNTVGLASLLQSRSEIFYRVGFWSIFVDLILTVVFFRQLRTDIPRRRKLLLFVMIAYLPQLIGFFGPDVASFKVFLPYVARAHGVIALFWAIRMLSNRYLFVMSIIAFAAGTSNLLNQLVCGGRVVDFMVLPWTARFQGVSNIADWFADLSMILLILFPVLRLLGYARRDVGRALIPGRVCARAGDEPSRP